MNPKKGGEKRNVGRKRRRNGKQGGKNTIHFNNFEIYIFYKVIDSVV